MPNHSWQFIAPNLPSRTQVAQPDSLTHRQFAALKLEVENKTLALQSQLTQPQAEAILVIPYHLGLYLRDVEAGSVRSVSSKRSRTCDLASTVSKRARSQTHGTTSPISLSPQRDKGLVLLLSQLRPVLNMPRIGQFKLEIQGSSSLKIESPLRIMWILQRGRRRVGF